MKFEEIKEKVCKKCSTLKPINEFYIQKQTNDDCTKIWSYYDCYCKKCRSKSGNDRKNQIKLRAVIYNGGKCEDCKYADLNHLEVFDFHHVDPTQKDFSISKSRKSFESIKKELDKCILLCANCHRIRHNMSG